MLEKILGFVNLGLWLCLFLSMLFAYLRGFRKSLSRFIATIISIILAFVFANALCNTMYSFNFGRFIGQGNMSFVTIIESLIKEIFDVKTIAADSAIKDFCIAAAKACIKVPIFFVMYSFLIILFRPLIAIIIRTLFPIPEGKTVSMRLAGVGVSVFTFFIVIWFWTFTLLGSKGILQECIQYYNDITIESSESQVSEDISELKEIENALDLFDDGSFIRVMTIFSGKNNSLEAKVLGKVTTIKTKNGDLNFVSEFENIMPVAKLFVNVKVEDEKVFVQYALENRETILKALETSEVINIILPIGIEIIDYTVEEIDVSGLKDVQWSEEKINLVNALRTVLDSIVALEIDFEKPLDVMDNPEFSNRLSQIGKAVQQSELIEKIVIVYANDIVHEMFVEKIGNDYPALLAIIDLTKINLEKDLKVIGDILVDLNSIGLFDDQDFEIISNGSIVSKVVMSVFELSTIQGNESKAIEEVLKLTKMDTKLSDAGININLNITNWKVEITHLAHSIELVLKIAEENDVKSLDDIDIIQLMENALESPTFDQLIDSICTSQVLNSGLISVVNKVIEDKDFSNIKSDRFNKIVSGEIPLDVNEFKSEIKLILKEITTISEIIDSDEIDVATIKTTLNNLCDSKYINIQGIVEMVFNDYINLNEYVEKEIIVPSFTNAQWKNEINSIFDIVDIIQSNGYLDEDFKFTFNDDVIQGVIDLLEKVNQSDIFRQIMPDLIKKVIPYQEFLSQWLLDQCGINEDNSNKEVLSKEVWEIEINKYEELLDYIIDENIAEIDLEELKSSDYVKIEKFVLMCIETSIFNCDGLKENLEPLLEDYIYSSGAIEKTIIIPTFTKDEWKVEVGYIFDAFELIQTNGYLDDSFELELEENSIQGIVDLMKVINQSEIFRQILPDIIVEVFPNEAFLSSWIINQSGLNGENNNFVDSKLIWSEEISKFENIIDIIVEDDIKNIDFDDLNTEDYPKVEKLFLELNNTRIINCDGLVSYVNEMISDCNIELNLIGVFDRNNNGTNKDEWTHEIPLLVSATETIVNIGEINNDTIKLKYEEIGNLLEDLKTSYLFGNDTRNDGSISTDDNMYNELIITILESSGLIKNIDNPNGFIEEDAALSVDWTIYNWLNELEILTSFDVELEEQSIETVKVISSSMIVKDFFDIATFVNGRLDSKQLVISKYDIEYTIVLKEYINDGNPLTNDDLRTLDWALELESIEEVIDIFDAGYNDQFKGKLEDLINLNNGTFAVETAASIKSKLMTYSLGSNSLWDLI